MQIRLTAPLADPWTHADLYDERPLEPEGGYPPERPAADDPSLEAWFEKWNGWVDPHGGRAFTERVYREFHQGDVVEVDEQTAEHLISTGQAEGV